VRLLTNLKKWRPLRFRAGRKVIPGLVSTIIPVYNRPALLAEAVESVVAQTYQLIEIIIVDDGSTDETASVCDRLAREYWFIKVIHQTHSGRPGRARDAGRLLARGEFIQYLDSDDLLLPQKFAVMTKALVEHPDCGIAYCYTRRYVKGEPPRDAACERTGETFDRMLPKFLDQRFWHTCTPLYRKSLCDKAGPWSDLAALEDMEYDMRIAKMNPRLYHCKEFLAEFRDHAEPRLSTAGFFIDPVSLRRLPRAYRLIYQHARDYGITYKDDAMRSFIGKIERLSHRCVEMGLSNEAEELAGIVHDVGGKRDGFVRYLQGTPEIPAFSSMALQQAETLFSVDSLNERIVTQQSVPVVVALEQRHLVVTGWAVDREAKDTAGAVYVTIDGERYPAHYSSDRKDVADHFGVSQYRYSGFEALIPNVMEGRHALSLVIVTKDRKSYYAPANTIEFELKLAKSPERRIPQ
jgi:glycosyltransferase involved in cell wall biosynthesis